MGSEMCPVGPDEVQRKSSGKMRESNFGRSGLRQRGRASRCGEMQHLVDGVGKISHKLAGYRYLDALTRACGLGIACRGLGIALFVVSTNIL